MGSSDDEMSVRGVSSARRQRLFSDDDDDDNDRRSVASVRSRSDAEDRGRVQSQRPDKDTDEEEEEEERRKQEAKKKKDEEKKKKPKGPVRRQMISEDMLTGKNGISKLPELFENFKFGGKGRERQDLDLILSKLEHWIHLLHPKQPFDQSLQRIEFLGLKRKVVKVHLKKIRMGMLDDYNAVEENENALLQDDDNSNDGVMEEVANASQTLAGARLDFVLF